jgi:uncharacterized membrane protein YphA (DoxX/SURF4 family)
MNFFPIAYAADVNRKDADALGFLFRIVDTYLIWIAGVAVIFGIVYAGVLFMTSAGDPQKVTKARNALLFSVLAGVLVFLGIGLISFIQTFF